MDLERLDEALRRLDQTTDVVRFAYDDGFEPIVQAARAYRDLANGGRVEPDYEAATRAMSLSLTGEQWVRAIVDAAIGDKLLVDPPTEED